MQRVSRSWRSFIHASRKTYASLDFSAARRDVPDSSLRAYINRSGGNVREAVLFRISDESAFPALVHQSRQLSILKIICSQITPKVLLKEALNLPNLTSLITDLPFSADDFRNILAGCSSLRKFECEKITWRLPMKAFTANLRSLEVRGSTVALPSPDEPLRDMVKCLPKLEKIDVVGPIFSSTVDFRPLESLSVLVLYRSRIRVFPHLPKSIRVLDISENPEIRWSLQDLTASPLPNLESFSVDGNKQIKNPHVLAILAPSLKKHSLRSLSFYGCSYLDLDSLEWLVKHGKNLERLEVGDNSTVGDEMSKEVAKFKKLRYLGLSHTCISGIGVMNVVNGSPNMLREVDITGCYDNHEAIQLDEAQLDAIDLISRRGGF